MKILQINPLYGYKSTGRNTKELHEYFISKKHKSYIAYFKGTKIAHTFIIGSDYDRKLHSFLSKITGLESCFSCITTKKLINYISNINPDIVLLGIMHSNYINFYKLLDYLAKKNVATVLVLHDCWYFTGKCMHYTVNKCYKWKKHCGNCPHLENGISTWFFDRTEFLLNKKREYYKKIDKLGVIGVSDWITNEAKQSVLKNAKSIKRIYNWIDLNKFYPRQNTDLIREKYNLKNKFIILGIASGWDVSKGLKDFNKLSDILNDDFKIILIGKCNKILSDKIVHIDATENIDKLAEFYSMADVFLTLSKEESFGKVSAEALACGTPVICYNSTASPELIGENCGIVADTGNIDSVIQAINKIKNNGKKFYSMNCIEFANKNFNYEKNAQLYLEFFKELVRSN